MARDDLVKVEGVVLDVAAGGTGSVIEYAGEAIRALSMEGRMTNLPITAVTIASCWGALALAHQWNASYVQLILVVGPVVAVCILAGYAALRHPLYVEVMKLLKGWRSA